MTAAVSVSEERLERLRDLLTGLAPSTKTRITAEVRNDIAACLRELQSRRARDAWRPIEAAPRDGTRIQLYSPDGAQAVGYWDAYYAKGGSGYLGGDGWIGAPSGEELRLHYAPPTHWQPLPSPPGDTVTP